MENTLVLAILSTVGGVAAILLKLPDKPRWRYFFATVACLCLLATFALFCYERQLANTLTQVAIYHPNDSDNANLAALKAQLERAGFPTELHCNPSQQSGVRYFFAEDRDRSNLVKAISETFLAAKGRDQQLPSVPVSGYPAKRVEIEIWIPHMAGSGPKPCPDVPH